MTTFEQQLKASLSHAYDIERELGGGGMSRVFVATEKALGRKIVVKVLSPELTAEVNRGRFRREIQVAAQLQHPHIVTLLSAGEIDDLVYYTMPFIKGESLKSALEKHGPLPVGEVVRVLYDVIDALAYAHENGVIHRDIKPANILRSGSHALVTDFGVAKALDASMPSGMTSTGMAVGTPAYMSPEQVAGDPDADHRIDIYAVGLLAYELLAGKSPFKARTPREVLTAVLTREPPPLDEARSDVPRRLSHMIMSCLSKDPDARPRSALALLDTLDMFSTASGEIRTREHQIPLTSPSTPAMNAAVTPAQHSFSESPAAPVALSSGAFSGSSISVAGNTASDPANVYAPGQPQKSRNKLVWGGILLLPVVAAAILLSQRKGASTDTSPAANAANVVNLANAANASNGPTVPVANAISNQQPRAGATPANSVPVGVLDSQAMRDSARARAARAARAEEARRAAAARADSQQRELERGRARRAARWAVRAMLADANARRSFMRGATHTGGVLGTRRRGDLQTQIDALQPFLANHGLTYDQFKRIVQEAGFNIFDEFGRIQPEALGRFARVAD